MIRETKKIALKLVSIVLLTSLIAGTAGATATEEKYPRINHGKIIDLGNKWTMEEKGVLFSEKDPFVYNIEINVGSWENLLSLIERDSSRTLMANKIQEAAGKDENGIQSQDLIFWMYRGQEAGSIDQTRLAEGILDKAKSAKENHQLFFTLP